MDINVNKRIKIFELRECISFLSILMVTYGEILSSHLLITKGLTLKINFYGGGGVGGLNSYCHYSYVCVCVKWLLSLYIHVCVCLSLYMYIYLSIHLSIYIYICMCKLGMGRIVIWPNNRIPNIRPFFRPNTEYSAAEQ